MTRNIIFISRTCLRGAVRAEGKVQVSVNLPFSRAPPPKSAILNRSFKSCMCPYSTLSQLNESFCLIHLCSSNI